MLPWYAQGLDALLEGGAEEQGLPVRADLIHNAAHLPHKEQPNSGRKYTRERKKVRQQTDFTLRDFRCLRPRKKTENPKNNFKVQRLASGNHARQREAKSEGATLARPTAGQWPACDVDQQRSGSQDNGWPATWINSATVARAMAGMRRAAGGGDAPAARSPC